MNYEVGKLIKSIRKEKKLSVIAFGNTFNPIVQKKDVLKWEKGRDRPDINQLKQIALMGNETVQKLLSIDYFVCGSCNKYVYKKSSDCPFCNF